MFENFLSFFGFHVDNIPIWVYNNTIERAISPKDEGGNPMNEKINAIAEAIRNADTWDMDLLAELCEAADMTEEWETADGDTFESVAFAAAEKLGVEIV